MKLNFYLEYEDEKITDFDIAKEIVETCHKSNYKLNARKIVEMILVQVKDGDLERLWNDLKDYLENTKNDYCDNGYILREMLDMEKINE